MELVIGQINVHQAIYRRTSNCQPNHSALGIQQHKSATLSSLRIYQLPWLKSLRMFWWFCAPGAQHHLWQPKSSETASHRLAVKQGVSHDTIKHISSKSQVFFTWREQFWKRKFYKPTLNSGKGGTS